ncbi:MAG: hypothetical protein IOD12_10095 [Silvanigrellales bacterium]|nr:hypothetical protein [Silvanigrellales bacterium]
MRRPFPFASSAAFALLAFAGCGKDENTGKVTTDNLGTTPSGDEEGRGCFMGVVTDGFTGKRVDLKGDISKKLFALTPAGARGATALSTVATDVATDVVGEYSLCGVPLGEGFPIYVKLDGYQTYFVDEKAISAGGTRDVPLNSGNSIQKFYTTPVEALNIVVFPTKQLVGDYKVKVRNADKFIASAKIFLKPISRGSNTVSAEDTFTPGQVRNISNNTLSGTTDKNGVATFKAADLVFGAKYEAVVYHPSLTDATAGRLTDGFQTSAPFVVGAPQALAGDDQDPFTTIVAFGDAVNNKLELSYVSGRTAGGILLPDAEGKITFTFNRDIALRTGGYEVDSLVGLTISDYGEKAFGVACSATDFVLATPTAGNAVAEMFTATVAGNTLTV